MIDKFNGILNDNGFYDGKPPTPTISAISNLEQGIDAELANIYPEYKGVKTSYF